jgi:hypothetical protein
MRLGRGAVVITACCVFVLCGTGAARADASTHSAPPSSACTDHAIHYSERPTNARTTSAAASEDAAVVAVELRSDPAECFDGRTLDWLGFCSQVKPHPHPGRARVRAGASLARDPSGRLVVEHGDEGIVLRDQHTKKATWLAADEKQALAFLHGGDELLTVSCALGYAHVARWSTSSGAALASRNDAECESDAIGPLVASVGERWIAFLTLGTAHVCDTKTVRCAATRLDEGAQRTIAIVASPSGGFTAVAEDQGLRSYRVAADGTLALVKESKPLSLRPLVLDGDVRISRDGLRVALHRHDAMPIVWNLGREFSARLPIAAPLETQVADVAAYRDVLFPLLLTNSTPALLLFWQDTPKGPNLMLRTFERTQDLQLRMTDSDSAFAVYSRAKVGFTNAREYCTQPVGGNLLEVFRPNAPDPIIAHKAPFWVPFKYRVSPDGQRAAFQTCVGVFLSPFSDAKPKTLPQQLFATTAMAAIEFAPGSKYIALQERGLGVDPNPLHVWKLEAGIPKALPDVAPPVYGFAFSADGEALVTGGERVTVLKLASDERRVLDLRPYTRDPAPGAAAVAVSNDGATVAAYSQHEGALLLWAAGAVEARRVPMDEPVQRAVFSASGDILTTVGYREISVIRVRDAARVHIRTFEDDRGVYTIAQADDGHFTGAPELAARRHYWTGSEACRHDLNPAEVRQLKRRNVLDDLRASHRAARQPVSAARN